jgi:hypothetical protein
MKDAYFAGLFDGEGSFSIGWSKKKNYINFSPKMTMSLKYGGEIIEQLQKRFGGSIYHYDDGMTRWNLSKKQSLISATNSLLPFLQIKKEIGIKFIEILDLFPKSRKEKWDKKRMNKVTIMAIELNPVKSRKRTLNNSLLK